MSEINGILEAAKETKERFSKFLKENYLDDSLGDDELLNVWSNWSVMDKEIESLREMIRNITKDQSFPDFTKHVQEAREYLNDHRRTT